MAIIDEKKFKNKNKKNDNVVGILNEKNIVKAPQLEDKHKKIINSFADIFPIRDIAEHDFFEMKNGEYMEIVQVTSKDIYALNEGDKDNDIFSLAYLFQAYIPDLKLVPLYTPVNLEIQKNRIILNIRNSTKSQYKNFLEKKLAELEFIEKHRTNKEFFFFLYADTTKTLFDRRLQIRRLLTQSNPMIELKIEKKINVLFQMCNLNTKPIVD